MEANTSNLSGAAVRNAFWAYMSLLTSKGVAFVGSIILARLLVPEEFGVVSICLIALSYLEILVAGGTEAALIARRERAQEAANAALVINLALSLIFLALVWFVAPEVALFFRSDTVTGLLRTLAFVLPITALGIVPDALLQKQLRFRVRVLSDAGSSLVKALVSIALAVAGLGAMSLILGQIAGEAAGTVLAWSFAHWRPSFQLARDATLQLLSYSWHMVMIGLVGVILGNADYLFIGRILGATALGFYTLAFRIPELIIGQITWAIGRAAFPLIATMHSNSDAVRSTYLKYLRYISLFTFPLAVGLALLAAPFILVFYTTRWTDSIEPMAFIAGAMAISSIGYMAGTVYKALNRPGILNATMLLRLPIALALLGYSTRFGIVGVSAAQCILALIFALVDSIVISRLLRFPPAQVFVAIQPALTGSLILALGVGGVQTVWSLAGLGGIIFLALTGAVIYLGTLGVVSRETIQEARFALASALLHS